MHVAVVGIFSSGAKGKLVKVELTHKDRPCPAEPVGNGAIEVRDKIIEYPRSRCVPDSPDIVQVFQAQGHTMQRAAIAPCADLQLSLPGSSTGLVGHDGDKRIQGGLQSFDPLKMGFHHLLRRHFSGFDQHCKLSSAAVTKFGIIHH